MFGRFVRSRLAREVARLSDSWFEVQRSQAPMTLSRYTTCELMVPRLRNRDASAAVAELCSVMHREQRVQELLPFFNAVINNLVCIQGIF